MRPAVVNPYTRVQAIPGTHQGIFSNPRVLLYQRLAAAINLRAGCER